MSALPIPIHDRADPLAIARSLADTFALTAASLDASGDFPLENIEALSRSGLLNLTVSRADGGHGAGLETAIAVVSEIARGEPSTALILAMHLVNHASITLQPQRWPQAVARRLVEASLAGPALVNAVQVEPEAGSPSYGTLPHTVARREGEGWRISGRKRFATGCEGLAFFLVSALTDEEEQRIGSFIVEAPHPGISIERSWDTTGMRATGSHDVIFDNVPVKPDFVLDLAPVKVGFKRDERWMAWFMSLIGAVYLGIGRSARNFAFHYAHTAKPGQLTVPLSDLPRIKEELGALEVSLSVAERLLRSLGRDFDEGVSTGPDSGIVRHVVIENAVRVTEIAQGIAGHAGVSRHHALERHHRDALCGRTHAPTPHLVRLAAANGVLARLED